MRSNKAFALKRTCEHAFKGRGKEGVGYCASYSGQAYKKKERAK